MSFTIISMEAVRNKAALTKLIDKRNQEQYYAIDTDT